MHIGGLEYRDETQEHAAASGILNATVALASDVPLLITAAPLPRARRLKWSAREKASVVNYYNALSPKVRSLEATANRFSSAFNKKLNKGMVSKWLKSSKSPSTKKCAGRPPVAPDFERALLQHIIVFRQRANLAVTAGLVVAVAKSLLTTPRFRHLKLKISNNWIYGFRRRAALVRRMITSSRDPFSVATSDQIFAATQGLQVWQKLQIKAGVLPADLELRIITVTVAPSLCVRRRPSKAAGVVTCPPCPSTPCPGSRHRAGVG